MYLRGTINREARKGKGAMRFMVKGLIVDANARVFHKKLTKIGLFFLLKVPNCLNQPYRYVILQLFCSQTLGWVGPRSGDDLITNGDGHYGDCE